ncbi:MAG: hypothetical protein JKY54_05175 [Flavobacteriales bacterium]|nr:hypothetical protein [Flavobacteriales bacterium]
MGSHLLPVGLSWIVYPEQMVCIAIIFTSQHKKTIAIKNKQKTIVKTAPVIVNRSVEENELEVNEI